MQIAATPIEAVDAQQQAIMQFRDTLDPTQRGGAWSHRGEAINAGLKFEWKTSGEKLNVILSLDGQAQSAVSCTIPIGSFNQNVLGLLAVDERGRRLLCRQKIPNKERSKGSFDQSFFSSDDGLQFDKFRVRRDGRDRIYFVLAHIDGIAAEIVEGLRAILNTAASRAGVKNPVLSNSSTMADKPLPPVGTAFATRRELFDAGVHRALQAGIVGTASLGAKSIVLSGGYLDDQDFGGEIIYTGEGGRDPKTGKQIADQEFSGHNQALVTSCLQGLPVRVVRSANHASPHSPTAGYRYDGLWRVQDYWHSPGLDGFLVCRYRMVPFAEPAVLQQQPVTEGGAAPRALSVVSRLIRDTEISRRVKQLHDFRCQVCGIRLECEGGPYAEAAHIRPLGAPHDGPDVSDNVLCLCPNHHVLFDRGGLLIEDDFNLIGAPGKLRRLAAHSINLAQIEYHRRIWGRSK